MLMSRIKVRSSNQSLKTKEIRPLKKQIVMLRKVFKRIKNYKSNKKYNNHQITCTTSKNLKNMRRRKSQSLRRRLAASSSPMIRRLKRPSKLQVKWFRTSRAAAVPIIWHKKSRTRSIACQLNQSHKWSIIKLHSAWSKRRSVKLNRNSANRSTLTTRS